MCCFCFTFVPYPTCSFETNWYTTDNTETHQNWPPVHGCRSDLLDQMDKKENKLIISSSLDKG